MRDGHDLDRALSAVEAHVARSPKISGAQALRLVRDVEGLMRTGLEAKRLRAAMKVLLDTGKPAGGSRAGQARERRDIAAVSGPPVPAVPLGTENDDPEWIVCLEDGRRLKMLKRHLRAVYGLSPEQYRQRWGLAADYPLVARAYAASKRGEAHKVGLGTAENKAGRRVAARERADVREPA